MHPSAVFAVWRELGGRKRPAKAFLRFATFLVLDRYQGVVAPATATPCAKLYKDHFEICHIVAHALEFIVSPCMGWATWNIHVAAQEPRRPRTTGSRTHTCWQGVWMD